MEVSIAEAKAKLSEVLREAEAGGEVIITRRGKAIARVTAAERKLKPIDLSEADAIRARQKPSKERAADWVRQMRDEDRF